MILKENINQSATDPAKVAKILQDILNSESEIDRDKEHFWVIGLTTSLTVKYIDLVSLGLLDRSLVAPREVFRLAILKGVKGIIIAHNHPSGALKFSSADAKITETLKQSGEILDIQVYDHVLITANGYKSYLN